MIRHIILFQFRDPEACIPTAREKLHSMQAHIPEILSMETGADIMHSGRSYDMALIATFADAKLSSVTTSTPTIKRCANTSMHTAQPPSAVTLKYKGVRYDRVLSPCS